MGIVSIGRSLVIRQLLLTGLVVALGAFAYLSVNDIESTARGLVATDVTSGTDSAAAILGASQMIASRILWATIVAAALMATVSIPVIHFMNGRPVKAVAHVIERLANGDRSMIVGDRHSDDLGVMAQSLQQIRDTLVAYEERAASEAKQGAANQDNAARAMSGRVETFSAEMSSHVRRLAAITKRLSTSSGSMILAAKHAGDGSDQATTASSNAAGDVSSVATASEQLLDSIEEISRQVVQSTNVVRDAVERAVETNAGMGRLSAAAQKVGDVVSLISRIAAQTNLLALNATIEAARAGEAGRGFAVVAQEVKTLATQTAKATQDITGQIAEMQEATELSVEAIDKIQRKISEVEHISTIIAAAVHEQGAATQEIARNVRSAAAGTATMSGHVENIVRSVSETSNSATEVVALAQEFDEIAATMAVMVSQIDGFALAVRAA